MSPRLFFATSLLVTLVCTLCACDPLANDGGDLPPGAFADFAILDVPADLHCGFFEDGVVAIRDQEDVDEVVAACAEEADGLASFLAEELASTSHDQQLIFITVGLGGCIAGHDLPIVALDDGVIRPWLLKNNTAYGKPEVACTADVGEALELLRVDEAGEATSAELTVGVWNSELPGSPYEEHGLSPQ